jgi:glycosyltransferase involved in cell wall biosynthesis/GT2 family glycosyltransferase
VQEDAPALLATLAALRATTAQDAEIVLLPDGPDPATAAAVAATGLPCWGTADRRGPAACLNRLAAGTAAPVLVLLENGARPAPGWLDHLLVALRSPGIGLAGPSTNRAWNEQGAFPGGAGDPAALAATAREAARRFAATPPRILAPLHSLGEFCLAIRRAAMEAVGAADEGYGDGPCWEMEFAARAARAGWPGAWAGAAYVWRAPWPAARQRREAERFEASRRRYQDRLCALRIRGEREGHVAHCRGEACAHFALPALLPPRAALPDPPPDRPAPARHLPLVSCLMPTSGGAARLPFALRALRHFRAQDYPERELVVLVDGPAEALAAAAAGDPRIRVEQAPPGLTIGAMRNRACALARGPILLHWDDDDWHGPGRISRQAAPILSGEADVSALRDAVFLDLLSWRAWRVTPALHARLFAHDVHGGTLAYQRRLWEQAGPFPEIPLAEDARFLERMVASGARLVPRPAEGCYVYLRHGRNAWSFACGSFPDPVGWQQVEAPPLPAEEAAFYRAAAATAPRPEPRPTATLPAPALAPAPPLVSCIMPTANRRRFAALAIRWFGRQDHHDTELVILDDGADPIGDLAAGRAGLRHIRLDRRTSVGAKRNLGCEESRGAFIAHWDDDDWYAPDRLSRQLAALLAAPGRSLCGVDDLLFWDAARGAAHRYAYPPGQRPWMAGSSMLYRREFWTRHRFQAVDTGEDALFAWAAEERELLHLRPPAGRFLVAMIHPGNVSPKQVAGSCWSQAADAEITALLGADLAAYLPERLEAVPGDGARCLREGACCSVQG